VGQDAAPAAHDRQHRRSGCGAAGRCARLHEAFYGPDTASLIVAGNFDEAQLNRWVDTYFGSIPARARKTPLAITERDPPRTKERFVTAYAPNVPLPVVGSLWQVPGSSHPDIPALRVLDAVLSQGNNSRFYQALVQTGLATSASGNLIDTEESGFYAANVIMAGGKALPDAEAALAREIEKVRSGTVSAAELAEAKNEIVADALRERETFSGRAFAMGEALVRTGDPRASDKELAAIARVTAADVQRVARKYLATNSRVAIRYVNEKERPAGQTGDSWANPVPLPVFKSVPPAFVQPMRWPPKRSASSRRRRAHRFRLRRQPSRKAACRTGLRW
jgi:zinc protease